MACLEELYELLETPDSSLEALIRAYVEAHAEEFFVDA
jgi:hypothetical protein